MGIEFLPDTEESRQIIADEANGYASRMIRDPEWLESLTPDEVVNVGLMVFAHASDDLFEKAWLIYDGCVEELEERDEIEV